MTSDAEWLKALIVNDDRSHVAREVAARTDSLIALRGSGLDLSDSDLCGMDLCGLSLKRANFNRALLHGTLLRAADLSEASMICVGMEKTDLRDAVLIGVYAHGAAAQVCDMRGARLDGLIDATGSLFHGCALEDASLVGAQLAGATFYQCHLERANLNDAALNGAHFNESSLAHASFQRAFLSQAVITKCEVSGANFTHASGVSFALRLIPLAQGLVLSNASLPGLDLCGVHGEGVVAEGLSAPGSSFRDCQLSGANFAAATLSASRWQNCSLGAIRFGSAKLDRASFIACGLPNSNWQRASCEGLYAIECSMPASDMRGLRARAAIFRECDLSGSDFRNAYLYRSMLTGDPPSSMDLASVNFDNANIVQSYLAADLQNASLVNTKAAYARLNQSSFQDATLLGTNLFLASMVKTDVTRAQGSGVKGPLLADRTIGLDAFLASSSAPARKVAAVAVEPQPERKRSST